MNWVPVSKQVDVHASLSDAAAAFFSARARENEKLPSPTKRTRSSGAKLRISAASDVIAVFLVHTVRDVGSTYLVDTG